MALVWEETGEAELQKPVTRADAMASAAGQHKVALPVAALLQDFVCGALAGASQCLGWVGPGVGDDCGGAATHRSRWWESECDEIGGSADPNKLHPGGGCIL